MRYISLVVLIVCISFCLCFAGSRDRNVTDENGRIAILTAGKWQMVESYARYVVKGDTVKRDRYHEFAPCFIDNYMIFGKNGKMYYDQGALKCNPLQKLIDSISKWRLEQPESILWIENASTYTNGLYIEYLDDSVLQVNEDRVFGDSTGIKVFKHVPRSKK